LCPIEWMKPVCILRCTTFLFLEGPLPLHRKDFFFPPSLFVLNKIYLFYRFMAALVCFISMAIWCEHCQEPQLVDLVLGVNLLLLLSHTECVYVCTVQEAPLPPFNQ
jgi:hypothetical protein